MTPHEQFRLLVGLSFVDGRLHPGEEDLLLRAARHLGVARDEAQAIVRQIAEGGRVRNLTPPADAREREQLFDLLVRLAAADGAITPQEQGVLQRLASPFGIHPGSVPSMLTSALAAVGAGAAGIAAPPPLPPGAAEDPPAAGAPAPERRIRLRRPARAGRKAARPRPQRRTGAASCPSCGAPVKFRNRRSVARVCEYCDTTLVRDDAGDALRELGKVSHLVADASPLRIGATGTCFGVGFSVLGRLQIEHETGLWNEWFLEWADGHTGWLGEALGQYLITFPARGEGIRTFVPLFDELSVGQRVVIDGKRYTVTELRKALATGTEGETPFVVEEGYELPYADLRRGSDGFGTIDYSEDPPLVFTGRCVSWPDLNLRGYRSFDGWQG